jgi:hypothetical protein
MRRAVRPQRRRVFFGCEGESERSYGTLLHQLVHERGHLHIDTSLLQPGGGDPLALVERAYDEIRRRERQFGGRYVFRALLLDRDRWGVTPARDQRIQGIVTAAKLHLIWQRPTHEAFLLRHLPGCMNLQPQTPADALDQLLQRWPDYVKGAPTQYLRARLTIDHVGAVCGVEPDLGHFLAAIRYF